MPPKYGTLGGKISVLGALTFKEISNSNFQRGHSSRRERNSKEGRFTKNAQINIRKTLKKRKCKLHVVKLSKSKQINTWKKEKEKLEFIRPRQLKGRTKKRPFSGP